MNTQPQLDDAQVEGGVQSEISMWRNRVFDSRSEQCHPATSWKRIRGVRMGRRAGADDNGGGGVEGGVDGLDRRRKPRRELPDENGGDGSGWDATGRNPRGPALE
jgi:hypothetical protein